MKRTFESQLGHYELWMEHAQKMSSLKNGQLSEQQSVGGHFPDNIGFLARLAMEKTPKSVAISCACDKFAPVIKANYWSWPPAQPLPLVVLFAVVTNNHSACWHGRSEAILEVSAKKNNCNGRNHLRPKRCPFLIKKLKGHAI